MPGKIAQNLNQLNRASIQEKWKFWQKNNRILLIISLALYLVIVIRGFDTLGFYANGSGGLSSDAAVLLFILTFIAGMEYTEYTIKPEIRKSYNKATRVLYIAAAIIMMVSSGAWICGNTAAKIVMPVLLGASIGWVFSAVLWSVGFIIRKIKKH